MTSLDWRELLPRFASKIREENGCWIWTAATVRGYGSFGVPRIVLGFANRANKPRPQQMFSLRDRRLRLGETW